MPTAEQIKHWLALVAAARLAVAQAIAARPSDVKLDVWEFARAAEYLDSAFSAGLEAHGQAVLKEYLAETEKTTAA